MIDYKQLFAGLIASGLEGIEADTLRGLIEYPPNPELGDLSLPCFKLSKQLRKAPQAIAEAIAAGLPEHEAFERAVAVSGYCNVYLRKSAFAAAVAAEALTERERFGSQNIGQGRTVVIDFSSPNIAKPFHIGHLRSTVIGRALYNIFSFLGYKTVGINHLGDWGTQFGKQIVAYLKWGNERQVEENGIEELQRLYVKFHEEADKQPELEDEARAWFVRLEKGDEEANRLWKWFIDISFKEFDKIYKLLGVTFDSYAGESFYIDKTEPVISRLKEKGLLEEDDGAMIVRLDDYNMAPALMFKKDGGSLYHTRDVAAAVYRKQHYDFDKCIYVTDYAQNLHFQQWFKIVELMGYEWANELHHVAFGRVSLEGARMSTRKGNVIKLEDLLQQAISKTRDIIEEKHPELDNKAEVAEQVGVGAIVFNDLSANRIKDIVFSWEEALNFDGETGPYVQYSYARTCSLLAKAGISGEDLPREADGELLQEKEAIDVFRQLYLFREKVELAMDKMEPSIVSRHLIDIAQSFNKFYYEHHILVDDAAVRQARLALVRCVQIALGNGLALIGLKTPERI